MLDIKLLREKALEIEGVYLNALCDKAAVLALRSTIEVDKRRKEVLLELEELKRQRNDASKKLASLQGHQDARADLLGQMDGVKKRITLLESQFKELDVQLETLLLQLPNIPSVGVPLGKTDSENVTLRLEGQKKEFDFVIKPHWELAERLGIIDFERGVKLSGSRFYILKAHGALLQRALISWMIDVHLAQGYIEVAPPYMVKSDCMIGTAQLPKFGDNLYRDIEEDFYFIPTAEVPVTNMYKDEIIDSTNLPIKHVAYTPCFRREKLAAGKDTRGIKRGHQFDKVEMVQFVHPMDAERYLDLLVDDAEEILRQLELPYRVVQMCSGDLSFAACKKIDLEVYSPGVNEWLEVSSCSYFGDFQARRAQIRFKESGKTGTSYVHTLNGSGLALPRTLIAILENYQNQDGSINIPKVLLPYLRGITKIG